MERGWKFVEQELRKTGRLGRMVEGESTVTANIQNDLWRRRKWSTANMDECGWHSGYSEVTLLVLAGSVTTTTTTPTF